MALRCTIEIVPFGVEEDKQQIFKFDISNQGSTDGDDCYAYSVKVMCKDDSLITEYNHIHHRRGEGAIKLVKKVLERFLVDIGV